MKLQREKRLEKKARVSKNCGDKHIRYDNAYGGIGGWGEKPEETFEAI